jgi:site-specific DNA-methyltransferase (adenine-specific)
MKPYFEDDLVTLYHGDALEVTEWLSADVLVTDPPYGIAWEAGALNDKKNTRQNAEQSIASDESIYARDKALEMWGNRIGIVFGTWKVTRPKNTTNVLIWHKANKQPGVLTHPFYSNHEEIYVLGTGFEGKPMQSVISTSEHRGRQPILIGHPTPKPIGLMEQLILKCPLGVIADPFAGSGATLVAARNLGRKVIGVELEEKYCELIANRLSQQVFDFGSLEA